MKNGLQRFQSAVFFNILFIILFLLSPSSATAAKLSYLSIVIDDIGYHPKEDAQILAMPQEIAVAIIPAAPYAAQRNRQASEQGRDILIHMPMQALNKHNIEAGGLSLGMSAAEVEKRVQNAKQIVSAAIGMNNHMGSAATADESLMSHLMRSLHKNRLFFLDSRTIGRSVAGKIAKQQGVGVLQRHIFLDDSNAYADVQAQFQQAIRYARKHGNAVVIGHPRRNTVAVLQEGLRNLPADIRLISIGSLWRNEKAAPPQPFILIFGDLPAPTSVPPFKPVALLRGVPE
ncbi:hypothetical protein EDC45_1302 [Mesocricetibacter intestinalis]|uniref:Divergent polysaccharide deacetylase n=1 Tax=Mesocricetibacter intestinalis TaxID=1521930 RepID=A0A4R6V848_9PAST|nr:divergent polysaccharide deacetylase family protein [Mesocricetibacter intestinalis]TDQ57655.1 hypothetical protein EDC45_1302 [Mesocricetibacter intestinalis]